MKRMFITDLDGTALGGNYPVYARFPECFAQMLDHLSANGWAWCINTTWDVEGQWKLVLDSPVKSRPAYLIGEFGRKIARVNNDRLELLQPYCDNNDQRVYDFSERKIVPLIAELNRNFMPEKIHFYGHLFQFISQKSKTNISMSEFASRYKDDSELDIRLGINEIVIKPAFLNKGLPVREIMRIEGLSSDAMYIAGDEPTDLAMMSPDITSHCICPANAAEAVRQHVRASGGHIATRPFGEGVAETINLILREKGEVLSAL